MSIWSSLWEGVKGLFGGKGTTQIGAHNKSVTTGDNQGTIVVGDQHVYQGPAPEKEIPRGPLSDRAKILLLRTLKDKDQAIAVWTPIGANKVRMQAASKRIYSDDTSHVEITRWLEALEEIKPFLPEKSDGNYFLRSEGERKAKEIASREPELGLSDEATAILKEAPSAQNGAIYTSHSGFGTDFTVGKIQWRNLNDPRKEAELDAAVQELRGIGAIEVYGNVGYKFTAKGFEMATRLNQIT